LIKDNFNRLKERFEAMFRDITSAGEGGEAVLSLDFEQSGLRNSSQLPAPT